MTKIAMSPPEPATSRSKAIRCPSGDQFGFRSWSGQVVSCVSRAAVRRHRVYVACPGVGDRRAVGRPVGFDSYQGDSVNWVRSVPSSLIVKMSPAHPNASRVPSGDHPTPSMWHRTSRNQRVVGPIRVDGAQLILERRGRPASCRRPTTSGIERAPLGSGRTSGRRDSPCRRNLAHGTRRRRWRPGRRPRAFGCRAEQRARGAMPMIAGRLLLGCVHAQLLPCSGMLLRPCSPV